MRMVFGRRFITADETWIGQFQPSCQEKLRRKRYTFSTQRLRPISNIENSIVRKPFDPNGVVIAEANAFSEDFGQKSFFEWKPKLD